MIALALRLASLAALAGTFLLPTTGTTRAQPEPTFRATCGELRAALKSLAGKEGEPITIEVEGPLSMVKARRRVDLSRLVPGARSAGALRHL